MGPPRPGHCRRLSAASDYQQLASFPAKAIVIYPIETQIVIMKRGMISNMHLKKKVLIKYF